MTEINYWQILERLVTPYARHMISTYGWVAEDKKLCAHFGVPTWWLRNHCGRDTRSHRIQLKKLEEKGLVISFKQSENQILWWPVGLIDKIKGNQ